MFAKALTLFAALGAVASAGHIGRRHSHGHQMMRRQNITSNGVEIINNVGKTVYLWSVSNTAGPMQTINNGESYAENWQTNPDGGGVSIKLSFTPESTNVLQYEYTYEDPTIWWDLSLINLLEDSEFTTMGFGVTSENPSCESAVCAAGDAACAAAYLFPDDNSATHSCQSQDLLTFTLGPVSASA